MLTEYTKGSPSGQHFFPHHLANAASGEPDRASSDARNAEQQLAIERSAIRRLFETKPIRRRGAEGESFDNIPTATPAGAPYAHWVCSVLTALAAGTVYYYYLTLYHAPTPERAIALTAMVGLGMLVLCTVRDAQGRSRIFEVALAAGAGFAVYNYLAAIRAWDHMEAMLAAYVVAIAIFTYWEHIFKTLLLTASVAACLVAAFAIADYHGFLEFIATAEQTIAVAVQRLLKPA